MLDSKGLVLSKTRKAVHLNLAGTVPDSVRWPQTVVQKFQATIGAGLGEVEQNGVPGRWAGRLCGDFRYSILDRVTIRPSALLPHSSSCAWCIMPLCLPAVAFKGPN